MPSRNVYQNKLNLHGTTQRERIINNTRNDLSNHMPLIPSYKIVLINDIEVPLEIQSTGKSNEKTFNTIPNDTTNIVNIGDSIAWGGMHWLVTEVDFDDEVTRSGKLIQCNLEIKFQNKHTYEIISRWCFAERPYANGIADGNIISAPNRQFRIKLPYDKETIQIDIGRRFILETIDGLQRTYKLLMPDLVTSKFQDSDGGFIVWNLEFDSIADPTKDNVELGICDYESPPSPAPPIDLEDTELRCEIVGSKTIRSGGVKRLYLPRFYVSGQSILDSSIMPKWSLNVNPLHKDIIQITAAANGGVEITCANVESVVNSVFTLSLTDINETYISYELEIEVIV